MNTTTWQSTDSHTVLLLLVIELAGVAVLAAFADASDNFAYVAVAFLLAVWLLFLMYNSQPLTAFVKKFTGG